MKSLRILHVIPALTWDRGGPAVVVAALARQQQLLGNRVAVLTTDQGARRGERPIEMPSAVPVCRARVRGPDRVAFVPGFSATVDRMLRESDVLHIHSVFRYPCLAAVRAASKQRKPVVIRPCGVLHRYSLGSRSSTLKALFLRRFGAMYRSTCDAWHYTSPSERRDSWPWEEVNGFVVPNGIDPEPFAIDRDAARAEIFRRWPSLEGERYVLFLGRLHPKKRVDLLLEAFLQAAPAGHKLVIAGPDEAGLWPRLQRRFLNGQRERGRVIRIGLVTGETKRQLLAGATLFALASEHENFGNAVLESLAAGTPVIGTENVDLIRDLSQRKAPTGEEMAFTAEMNLESWRERLSDILSRGVSDGLVRAARDLVAQRYHWSRIAARITDEYRSIS